MSTKYTKYTKKDYGKNASDMFGSFAREFTSDVGIKTFTFVYFVYFVDNSSFVVAATPPHLLRGP